MGDKRSAWSDTCWLCIMRKATTLNTHVACVFDGTIHTLQCSNRLKSKIFSGKKHLKSKRDILAGIEAVVCGLCTMPSTIIIHNDNLLGLGLKATSAPFHSLSLCLCLSLSLYLSLSQLSGVVGRLMYASRWHPLLLEAVQGGEPTHFGSHVGRPQGAIVEPDTVAADDL